MRSANHLDILMQCVQLLTSIQKLPGKVNKGFIRKIIEVIFESIYSNLVIKFFISRHVYEKLWNQYFLKPSYFSKAKQNNEI